MSVNTETYFRCVVSDLEFETYQYSKPLYTGKKSVIPVKHKKTIIQI